MSQRQQVRFLCFLAIVLGGVLGLKWLLLVGRANYAAEWVVAPPALAQAASDTPAEVVVQGPPLSKVEDAGDKNTEVNSLGSNAVDCGSLLDLNTATQADLETLPGIGPVIARAIVEAREARGSFQAVEDLLAVKGIGPARLSRLAPLVCASGTGKS